MGKHPILHYINEIKNKLGFSRTMIASGADVVDAVNKQAGQIVNLQNGIAYVENGDTATQKTLYNYGEYILWKGVLYYVSDINGIAQGATLAGKVAQPPTGGLNRVFDHYSSNETIVGTWIDGKPIYRRVLSGTLPSTEGTYTIGTIGAISKLISARFIIEFTDNWSADGAIYSGTSYTPFNIGYVDLISGGILYKNHVIGYFGQQITAIIEYVK